MTKSQIPNKLPCLPAGRNEPISKLPKFAYIKPMFKVLVIEVLVISWLLVLWAWLFSPVKPSLTNKGNLPER